MQTRIRRTFLALFAAGLAALPFAVGAGTTEILTDTTATDMTPTVMTGRTYVTIQNLGPNAEWCAVGATPVTNKSTKIASGDTVSLPAPATSSVQCLTSVKQVTGAASIVTQGAGPASTSLGTVTSSPSGTQTVQGLDGGYPVTVSGSVTANAAPAQAFAFTEVWVRASTDGGSLVVPATPLAGRTSMEIQNDGPNAIWCGIGFTPAVGHGHKIPSVAYVPYNVWAPPASDTALVSCIAETADQVDGGAGTTQIHEVR